jgi:Tfp pilus assembly protein PilO
MTPRIAIAAVAAAAVLLTVAFWFLLYNPLRQEQADLRDEIAALETRQVQLRNEITQLEEIEANELEIRAALARLEDYIPTGTAQPTAIRQLQVSADAAGVQITSVTFGSPEVVLDAPATGDDGTALAAIPMTVVVEGGYFQKVDFFRRLEVDVPRAILVQSISMGPGGPGFPTLATTASGQLFAVVPVGNGEPAPDPDVEIDDEDDEDVELDDEVDDEVEEA